MVRLPQQFQHWYFLNHKNIIWAIVINIMHTHVLFKLFTILSTLKLGDVLRKEHLNFYLDYWIILSRNISAPYFGGVSHIISVWACNTVKIKKMTQILFQYYYIYGSTCIISIKREWLV